MLINNVRHWTIKPGTVPIPRDQRANPNFEDATGMRFGSFEVVGFLGRQGAQSAARWLCRCMCGEFEPRTIRAMKLPSASADECIRCTYHREIAA